MRVGSAPWTVQILKKQHKGSKLTNNELLGHITPYTKALTDNMILIPWKMIKLNIVGSIQHCFSHREGSTVLYVINSTIYTLIYSTSTITLPKHKITDLFRETMKADGTFVQIFFFSPKWIEIFFSSLDLAHKQIIIDKIISKLILNSKFIQI